MRKFFKGLTAAMAVFSAVVFGFIIVGERRIPDEFNIVEGAELNIGMFYSASKTSEGEQKEQNVSYSFANEIKNASDVEIKAFRLFPVKRAKVTTNERRYAVPGGEVIGIRLYTNGVIVVGIDDVMSETGLVNPGKAAGLQEGDIIKSIDGKIITQNSDVAKCFENSGGNPVTLQVTREGKDITLIFRAVKSATDGKYRGGLWVRDSSAGIGTISFYDPETGIFGSLGHAICDVDTKTVMPLSGGDILTAHLKGVYKGSPGVTGELCGVFGDKVLGSLRINSDTGLYGVLHEPEKKTPLPVATKNEVQPGEAEIYSTVENGKPEKYKIKIVKVNLNEDGTKKNMTIEITDSRLIAKTGGIVQGMSGSPIIQNGMLVGAVTHVFLNNPVQGFGIFAETMLETADKIKAEIDSLAPAA